MKKLLASVLALAVVFTFTVPAFATDLVRVYYEYDNVFYNTTHIKNKALELYQKAYDETFTILYGVWPSLQYVEYNWRNDYSWTNPANNPFA